MFIKFKEYDSQVQKLNQITVIKIKKKNKLFTYALFN